MKNTDIGVLVGRFQTPELHQAHIDLLNEVIQRHSKVILFLGESKVPVTRRNPLDYTTRMLMIKEAFPDLIIQLIEDQPTHTGWAQELDRKIREIFKVGSVTMYGGRDSFIDLYVKGGGKFDCKELESRVMVSATDIRKRCSNEVKKSYDFRAGVVYAAFNQYPRVVPCVDIAILRLTEGVGHEVLIARKSDEPGWRFVGGHVDPKDKSLEVAARREAEEETGVSISSVNYIGSYLVDDWRYANEIDKIMTTFFAATYMFGRAVPSDDVHELQWVSVSSLSKIQFQKEHTLLVYDLITWVEQKEKEICSQKQ